MGKKKNNEFGAQEEAAAAVAAQVAVAANWVDPSSWANAESWERAEEMTKLNPEIVEFCDRFEMDEKLMWKLNDIMLVAKAKGTFDDDMLRLWCEFSQKKVNNPPPLLVHYMGQMKSGVWLGYMSKPDPEIIHLTKKFSLDEEAVTKLCEYIRVWPKAKRMLYYIELELNLDESKFPTKMVMMNLKKIRYGDPIGPPKGKGKGKGGDDKGGKGKGKDGDRDRSRDRGRDDRGRDDRRDGRDRSRDRGGGYDRDRGGDRRGRSYDRDRGGGYDRDRGGYDRDRRSSDRDHDGHRGGGSDRDRRSRAKSYSRDRGGDRGGQ